MTMGIDLLTQSNDQKSLDFLATFLQFPRVRDALIAEAEKTPYFHLYGSEAMGRPLYMGRWWLHQYHEAGDMGARLHHIARPDADRQLHDHPYSFTSVVLRGGYVEALPKSQEGVWGADGREEVTLVERRTDLNPVVFRQAKDRHQIVSVLPDTLTLFITGPKSEEHSWGFYTQHGFISWREYLGESDEA